MENDLFDSLIDETQTGFRLKKFELYNWGTFDQDIWTIEPNAQNALLTGDIGSGKSTVVDAITTLLVSPQKITFNKAAGAAGKERNLASYVKGYYKSEKNQHDLSGKPIALRDSNDYSVILGYFHNQDYQIGVTLAQVFWIKDNKTQPERFYISSNQPLSIAKHFCDFGDDISQLKKQLKITEKITVFDRFKHYETELKRQLGFNSTQALDLFYQTVSMKSVGNLTDFVRNHMLEKQPIEKTIDDICIHFFNLDQAHKSVLKAKDQIKQLQPIHDAYNHYCQHQKTAAHQKKLFEQLPIYFALIKQKLYKQRVTENEQKLAKLLGRIKRANDELERKTSEEKSLEKAILENGGQRIADLKNQIEQKTIEQKRRKKNATNYKLYCNDAKLDFAQNEQQFQSNIIQAKQQKSDTENSLQLVQGEATDNEILIREKQTQEKEINKELLSLKKQPSNIFHKNLVIREKLCLALGVKTNDLPFAGELIQVREKQQKWQGAIERVMHNYALSLLVPEKLYHQVADYVNKTHLGGRLVYFKTQEHSRASNVPDDKTMLYHKLQFNTDSGFYDWLRADIIHRFKYHCCEDLISFKKHSHALSLFGQIKSGGQRHEKDDRFNINDASRFVLGWTNEQKITLFEQQLTTVQQKGQKLFDTKKQLAHQLQLFQKQKDSLQFLLKIDTFNEIYWQQLATEINEHTKEIEALKASSNKLELLEQQLQKTQSDASVLKERKDGYLLTQGKTEEALESDKQMLDTLHEKLFEQILDDTDELKKLSDDNLETKNITINNADSNQTKLSKKITSSIRSAEEKAGRISNKIVILMEKYKGQYKADSKDLDSHIDASQAFIDNLNKLKDDDLPRHEATFSTMLKTDTIQDIVLLQSHLDKEQKEIKDKIKTINESLTEIDYNDGSYIILLSEEGNDSDVREFKQNLKQCISNTVDSDNIYNEQKFLHVKKLIDRFNGQEGSSEADKKWTKKVTDVRNWFIFSASERWKADDSEKEHFSDSSGKSGGQKEKLAYTVLASALAYQFGLKWGESKSKSFRFVMIDEAFGKGSDESTHYALELFKKLNLQLLIVTPLQKIHVIENYIKNVHLVNNREGKFSEINNLTIEQYKKNQIKFLEKQGV